MEMKPYIVYVKPNSDGYITAVNSSAFLPDTTGWVDIDSGYGNKYHHAQGNFFTEPVMTDGGAYRYKLVDGKPVECTADELDAQEAKKQVNNTLSVEERLTALERVTPVSEYVSGTWYYRGDKVLYSGLVYTCIAPVGVVCVWSPSEYPSYWLKNNS